MTFWRPAGLCRVAAVAAVAAMLCGCFEYHEEITFEKDGSGTVRIEAWIDVDAAREFKGEKEDSSQPPINKGMINQAAIGSANVELVSAEVYPEANKWVYNITLRFDDVSSLKNVLFFRGRNLVYWYVTAKEIRFGESVVPTLVDMAKARAEILQDTSDYAYNFFEADPEKLKEMTGSAKLAYAVVMPGASAVAMGSDITDLGGNKIRAEWAFTMKDLTEGRGISRLDLVATLPPEKGFTQVVIVLLLASVVGIIGTAIRLLMIKMKGGS